MTQGTRINVRCTLNEKKEWKKKASDLGINISQLVRAAIQATQTSSSPMENDNSKLPTSNESELRRPTTAETKAAQSRMFEECFSELELKFENGIVGVESLEALLLSKFAASMHPALARLIVEDNLNSELTFEWVEQKSTIRRRHSVTKFNR